MLLGFDTNSELHARAALILYAMYKSRDSKSSLNGVDTWTRFVSYIKGSMEKATNTAEFCDNFCEKAMVGSIKPRYLKVGDGPIILPTGELIQSEDFKDYQLDIFSDDRLTVLFEKETQLLAILVRDRIQREKLEVTEEEDDETDD